MAHRHDEQHPTWKNDEHGIWCLSFCVCVHCNFVDSRESIFRYVRDILGRMLSCYSILNFIHIVCAQQSEGSQFYDVQSNHDNMAESRAQSQSEIIIKRERKNEISLGLRRLCCLLFDSVGPGVTRNEYFMSRRSAFGLEFYAYFN